MIRGCYIDVVILRLTLLTSTIPCFRSTPSVVIHYVNSILVALDHDLPDGHRALGLHEVDLLLVVDIFPGRDFSCHRRLDRSRAASFPGAADQGTYLTLCILAK